jgi:hypothetical protein
VTPCWSGVRQARSLPFDLNEELGLLGIVQDYSDGLHGSGPLGAGLAVAASASTPDSVVFVGEQPQNSSAPRQVLLTRFFLPLGTARYTAVTVVTAGVR